MNTGGYSHRERIYTEQVRVLYGNASDAQLANFLIALIFIYLQWGNIEPQSIGVWSAAMALLLLSRALLIGMFQRSELTPEAARVWARRHIVNTFLIGSTWGVTAFMFPLVDNPDFALFILGGLMAGAIGSNAAVLPAYFAFAIPIAAPLSLVYFLQGDPEGLAKGGMIVLFIVVMAKLAVSYSNTLKRAQQLYIEHREVSEELRRHRDHLQELVADRTSDLKAAMKAAESANTTKNEFLANMTHELRTPMHAILSFADLGRDKAEGARRQQLHDYFSYIHDSGKRLLTLLNDLLDLARFEAHGMAFDFRENDIHQLVNTVAVELGGLLNTSKISLEVGEALDDGKLCCDETRILQVLRNLIANAIKVSPAGAQISVHFAQTEAPMGRRNSDSGMAAAIEVHVMDQGPGIPAEELELIFKKFVQSSKTKSRAGGTGLGLAICKQIVEAHGGLISAENRADGGAMFTLSLPRVTHPALAASLEAERLPEHEA